MVSSLHFALNSSCPIVASVNQELLTVIFSFFLGECSIQLVAFVLSLYFETYTEYARFCSIKTVDNSSIVLESCIQIKKCEFL